MRKLFALIAALAITSTGALATQSSKTTCETLLADNTTGAISPQDLRDCTTESVPFLDGTHTAQFINPDGSTGSPSLAFSDAVLGTDSGLYWNETSDYLGVVVDGTENIRFYGSTNESNLGLRPITDGSGTLGASGKRFAELYVSTIYNDAGGFQNLVFQNPIQLNKDGSTSTPAIAFADAVLGVDQGFLWDETNDLIGVAVNGTQVAAFDTTGLRVGLVWNNGSPIGFSDSIEFGTDNNYDIGSATFRVQDVYALNLKADDAGTAVTIPAIDNDGSGVVFNDIIVGAGGAGTCAEDTITFSGSGTTNLSGVDVVSGSSDVRICRSGDAKIWVRSTDTRIGNDLVPDADNSWSLGADALRWTALYLRPGAVGAPAISFDDSVNGPDNGFIYDDTNNTVETVINGVAEFEVGQTLSTIGSHFTPNFDSAYDLGSSSLYWDQVYADESMTGRLVDNQTASASVTRSTDMNKLWTNSGAAGAITLTLPTLTVSSDVGQRYTFAVMTAQTLNIKAGTADFIRVDGTLSSSGGTISSATIGDVITLEAVSTSTWLATSWVSPTNQW